MARRRPPTPSTRAGCRRRWAGRAWLAAGEDPAADVTAHYFFHRKPELEHQAAADPAVQDALLAACTRLTGIVLA